MVETIKKISLALLSQAGLNPTKRTLRGTITLVLSLFLIIFLFFFIMYGLIFKAKDISSMAKMIETVTTYIQVSFTHDSLLFNWFRFCFKFFVKASSAYYYRKDLAYLMRSQYVLFWDFSTFETAETREACERLSKRITIFSKLLLFMVGLTYVSFILKPFLPGRSLPLHMWLPEEYVMTFYVAYIAELYLILFFIWCIIGFDILFVYLSVGVLIQFKLLNERLSNINFQWRRNGVAWQKSGFIECVKHHEFLTKYVERMREIFSLFFVTQVFLTIFLFCMQMYQSTVLSIELGTLFKNFAFTISLLCQSFLYCTPPAEIITEVSEILQNKFWLV